jgi:hypothetical protein
MIEDEQVAVLALCALERFLAKVAYCDPATQEIAKQSIFVGLQAVLPTGQARKPPRMPLRRVLRITLM